MHSIPATPQPLPFSGFIQVCLSPLHPLTLCSLLFTSTLPMNNEQAGSWVIRRSFHTTPQVKRVLDSFLSLIVIMIFPALAAGLLPLLPSQTSPLNTKSNVPCDPSGVSAQCLAGISSYSVTECPDLPITDPCLPIYVSSNGEFSPLLRPDLRRVLGASHISMLSTSASCWLSPQQQPQSVHICRPLSDAIKVISLAHHHCSR